jgi:hypothetical protein
MSSDLLPAAIEPVTRQAQFIFGSLILGASIFLAIAARVEIRPNQGEAGAPAADNVGLLGGHTPVLTFIAIAFAALAIPLSAIFPRQIVRQQRLAIAQGGPAKVARSPSSSPSDPSHHENSSDRWLPVYTPQLLVGAAILEAPTFFAAGAYLLEKNQLALCVAFVLLVGLLGRFPTVTRVERWIAQQEETLRDNPS